MPPTGSMINLSCNGEHLVSARWCGSFFCRLRGLTFRRSLAEGEALLLVERAESRMSTSIHMLMVFFPISAIWLNAAFEIVDKQLAMPWKMYSPSRPAKYVLEGSPSLLDKVSIGDRVEWKNA